MKFLTLLINLKTSTIWWSCWCSNHLPTFWRWQFIYLNTSEKFLRDLPKITFVCSISFNTSIATIRTFFNWKWKISYTPRFLFIILLITLSGASSNVDVNKTNALAPVCLNFKSMSTISSNEFSLPHLGLPY